MAIYMHPIDQKPTQLEQDNWVEIDLISWNPNNSKKNGPTKITLIRRLDFKNKKPCLQKLMFTKLKRRTIDELRLEIPQSTNSLDYKEYVLRAVNVMDYLMCPVHDKSERYYEKLVITAQSKDLY